MVTLRYILSRRIEAFFSIGVGALGFPFGRKERLAVLPLLADSCDLRSHSLEIALQFVATAGPSSRRAGGPSVLLS